MLPRTQAAHDVKPVLSHALWVDSRDREGGDRRVHGEERFDHGLILFGGLAAANQPPTKGVRMDAQLGRRGRDAPAVQDPDTLESSHQSNRFWQRVKSEKLDDLGHESEGRLGVVELPIDQ